MRIASPVKLTQSLLICIADCLITESAHRKSVKALNKILGFDPYINLCSLTLQVIFDEGRQNDDVAEDLILNYSYDYSEDAKAFQDILLNGYCILMTIII